MKRRLLAVVLAQMLIVGNTAMPACAAGSGISQEAQAFSASEDEAIEEENGTEATGDEIIKDEGIDALTLEESLSSQEEVLVGRPAASEVTECEDEGAFAQALMDINYAYPCDFEGEILLDQENGLVTDETGEELVGADRYVTAALLEEDTDAAVKLLTESGYANVSVEDGMIRADDRYASARIFVTSTEPVDTRGALSVVTFGNTYLLQYASSDEAAIAAEMLRDDPGVTEVMPDFVIKPDYAGTDPQAGSDPYAGTEPQAGTAPHTGSAPEAPETALTEETSDESLVGRYFKGQYGYKSKAISYMGIDTFLDNVGTLNNNVTVAVIDSGYDTNCKYVDYNRVLAGRGVVLAGSTMRDVRDHGTFILNQIYEATDAAVRLIPIKISDNTTGEYDVSILLSALYNAVSLGADFVNISLGGEIGFFDTFTPGEEALQYALDNQCYVIAAAGNSSTHVNFIWPAKSSRCLTIASISYVTSRPAAYSNYGDAIDFTAPGGDDDGLIHGYASNNKYVGMGGSSMAAPYYTAILANLKANGRSYSSLSGIIKSLSGYCEESLAPGASEYSAGNGCVYLPNAINRTIKDRCVKDIADQAYTGSAITPSPVVTYNGAALTEGRDYVLSYRNNFKIGTATVTVTGRGVYKGKVVKEFSIVRRNLAKATLTTKYKTYDFTGNPRKPAVTVKLDGKTLIRDTDYTLEYIDNVGPGTATIRAKGIGNYTGSATTTFGLVRRVTSVTPGLTYILVPKLATDRAATLKSGAMVNNTAVRVNAKTGAESQQFKIRQNSDGSYSFINMKCELALDSYNGKTDAGVNTVIRSFSSSYATQKWLLEPCSDGTFLIVNKKSGLALGVHDGAALYADIRMHTKSGSSAQRFYLEQISTEEVTYPYDGTYSLGAYKNTDFVIDIPAASKASGTVLQVYKANGTAAQQFRFIYSGAGTYRIVNKNSGKVLMPTRSKAAAGAAIVQGCWSGATCQRWRITERADHSIVLENCAGYYLEMSGNIPENGLKLKLNEYKAAQRFMWVRKK